MRKLRWPSVHRRTTFHALCLVAFLCAQAAGATAVADTDSDIGPLSNGSGSALAEHRPAGPNAVSWDARDASGRRVSSGVYFYELRAATSVRRSKLTVLK